MVDWGGGVEERYRGGMGRRKRSCSQDVKSMKKLINQNKKNQYIEDYKVELEIG